jgi:hypothetical protein
MHSQGAAFGFIYEPNLIQLMTVIIFQRIHGFLVQNKPSLVEGSGRNNEYTNQIIPPSNFILNINYII